MTDYYRPQAMITEDGVILVHLTLNGKTAMASCPLEMWPEFRGWLFTVQNCLEEAGRIADPAADVPPAGASEWN